MKRKISLAKLSPEDLECSLCHYLMIDPMTTSCGHSFCKACILQSFDHNTRCPLCRNLIEVNSTRQTPNLLLSSIIAKLFPSELLARREETSHEAALNLTEFDLPLFPLRDVVLYPGQKLPLHVFEPRYRLLVRRVCEEGQRRFGIVAMVDDKLAPVGTVAVIKQLVWLPDGRALLSVQGERRFRITSTWSTDGYRVGRVIYLDPKQDFDEESTEQEERDSFEPPLKSRPSDAGNERTPNEPLNTTEPTEAQNLYQEAKKLIETKLQSYPQWKSKIGEPPREPSHFSYWLSSLLPFETSKKQEMLEQSCTERLKEGINFLSNTNV